MILRMILRVVLRVVRRMVRRSIVHHPVMFTVCGNNAPGQSQRHHQKSEDNKKTSHKKPPEPRISGHNPTSQRAKSANRTPSLLKNGVNVVISIEMTAGFLLTQAGN